MNRSAYILLGLLASTLGLASCSGDREDQKIEHLSRDGFYKAPRSVYMYFSTTESRQLRRSYGTRPDDEKEFTVDVPVRHTGTPTSQPLSYRVRVDEAASTARVGVHFKPLESQYTFMADSIDGTFPVVFLRDGLTTEIGTADTLTLVLEPTSDLTTPFSDLNRVRIVVSNSISIDLEYWKISSYQYFLGDFSLRKYRAVLAYYNNSESELSAALVATNMTTYYRLVLNIEAAYNAIGEPIPEGTQRMLDQFRQ